VPLKKIQLRCIYQKILTRIRGSVTNNNGFWIGWLDLLHLIYSQLGTTGNTALSLFYTMSPRWGSTPRLTDWLTDRQSRCDFDFDYSTHFQFTVVHALGFSVFTSRILATDLSQSYCHLKSHVKSSRHRLIPLLSFLRLPIPRLDSTTAAYSSVLRLLLLLLSRRTLLITIVHGPHWQQPVLLTKPVYRAVA
jgi:hypothetical protein